MKKERSKIDKKNKHYTGFAAMVGRPNVGKSTLTNALIGEKIAIMSDRPQTTRNKIMCILNTDNAQIMFLDTPGIHKPHHKLGQYMVRAAESTLKEVDVILFVVDVSEKRGAGEDYIIEQLKKVKTPVILVANKVDKLEDKSKLFGIIANYVNDYNFAAVVPVSALEDTDFKGLVDEITKHLPEGPAYYDEDMITDQPERVIAAEMIRKRFCFPRVTKFPIPLRWRLKNLRCAATTIFISAPRFLWNANRRRASLSALKAACLKKSGLRPAAILRRFWATKYFWICG